MNGDFRTKHDKESVRAGKSITGRYRYLQVEELFTALVADSG